MRRILALAALAAVLVSCTPEQIATLGVTEPATVQVLADLPDVAVPLKDGTVLELDGSITALEVADRLGVVQEAAETPGGLRGMPFAPAGLSNCDEMAFYRVQAGLPERFQALGYRESNCRNEDGVHTSCCWGYWQAHQGNWSGTSYAPLFRDYCQAQSYRDVNSDNPLEKQKQACVARVMFNISGYRPWAL